MPNTTTWKDNQAKQLTSEGLLEVSYIVTDPDLADADADTTSPLFLSDLPAMLIDEQERTVTAYATLEKNLWLLDGSKDTVPDSGAYDYSGYISEALCDGKGLFITNPVIHLEFEELVEILPGLTITWGEAHGDYPTKFRIKLYNEASSTLSWDVENNKDVISVVLFEMREFNKLDIEVLEWKNPFRRARVSKIFLGVKKVYFKDSLLNFSSTQFVDSVTASLPKYEISVELDNRSRVFDPQNPDGLSKYMMERQQIRTRYGYKLDGEDVYIPGGVYYLSEWNAPRNGLSASFKARDLLGFMNAVYKDDFVPDGTASQNLAALVLAVLEKADLPKQSDGSDPWVLDINNQISTKAALPTCSLSECLQLIANAACCVMFFSRDGKLHIEPQNNEADEFVIDEDHSYSRAEVNIPKPVKQIDVSWFDYGIDPGKPEEKFVHVIDSNGTELVGENRQKGEIQPSKNSLITDATRARIVGGWLYGNLSKRKTASLNWRVDPGMDVLDTAMIVKDAEDEAGMKILITSANLSFNGAFKGKSEGVVIE